MRDDAYFLETCPESVEEAIIAFLASESFEDAIYKAIALGGDADTQASIAGAIAEAFYKTTFSIKIPVEYLSADLLETIEMFNRSV